MAKKIFLVGAIVVLALLVGGYNLKNINLKNFTKNNVVSSKTDIGQEEAKSKIVKFAENNMVNPGTKVETISVFKEGVFYRAEVLLGEEKVVIHLSLDGKKIMVGEYDLAEIEKQAEDKKKSEAKELTDVAKNSKPVVELFVMSYCPFGTQIEKGILPVVDLLKDKIDFKLKFVDYAMHEKKEIDENTRQYCIQKDQPEKLNAYLTCFLKKGEGTEAACMASSGVNSSQVNSCMSAADKEFRIAELYKDKASWQGGQFPQYNVDKSDNEKYGVEGSPTLVVNGSTVKTQRDPKSLLAAICSGFENQPAECQQELSAASPSSGFGEGTGSTGSASCGS